MSFRQLLKKHSHVTAAPTHTNYEGGPAFDLNSPIEALLSITGGSFFAEPRYYDSSKCRFKVGQALEARIQLTNNKLVNIANTSELDDVAKRIVALTMDVLNGDRPQDVLILARFLRNRLNIRLTPQVLLVLAASHSAGQGFVRKYANTIVLRPDEIKTCLLLWRFFFGQKCVPNCLGLGLADRLSQFSESALLKYDGSDFPTWKDVLRWLPRRTGYPLNRDMQRYFTHDEVSDAVPIIKARKELAKCTTFDDRAKALIVKSHANWEVVLSQFKNRPEVWSHLVEYDLVGYMALLRNLKNLQEANVNEKIIDKVCSIIADRQQVLNSKQLPFRFISALKAAGGDGFSHGRYGRAVSSVGITAKIQNALYKAIEYSAENITELPGVTAVFADNSGSMSSPVSAKSELTCLEAANILAAMVAKRCQNSYVCSFGTEVGYIGQVTGSSIRDIYQRVLTADIKGHGTDAWKCVKWLMSQKIKVDRIILLSDMQCYNSGGYSLYGGTCNGSLQGEWEKYRAQNKNCWLHTVHLNGYGSAAVEQGKNVNLLSGFSEKLFDTLLTTEGVMKNETGAVTTIDQIRAEFTL